MKIPKPKAVISSRKQFTNAHTVIRKHRHEYQENCLQPFLKQKKDPVIRVKFCFAIAWAAKEAGLYAASTGIKGIAFTFVRKFYHMTTPMIPNCMGYQTWHNWLQRECIDWQIWKPISLRRLGIRVA